MGIKCTPSNGDSACKILYMLCYQGLFPNVNQTSCHQLRTSSKNDYLTPPIESSGECPTRRWPNDIAPCLVNRSLRN